MRALGKCRQGLCNNRIIRGISIAKISCGDKSRHAWTGSLDREAAVLRLSLFQVAGRLVQDGVYSMVRHPQYTGIFLAVFGQLVHWPTIPTLALAPLIVWIYVRLARREEAHLIETFGEAYRAYQRRVPMFLPRWRDVAESPGLR